MLFNDISYLELWLPFCSAVQNHFFNNSRAYQDEQFYERIYQFGPVVQEDISFKGGAHLNDFLPGALAPLLFSGADHLCNFERGHHEEH